MAETTTRSRAAAPKRDADSYHLASIDTKLGILNTKIFDIEETIRNILWTSIAIYLMTWLIYAVFKNLADRAIS